MEDRITKIEKDLAVLAESNRNMSENMSEIKNIMSAQLELQKDTALTQQQVYTMEKRIEKLEDAKTWFTRTIIGALIMGGIGSLYYLARSKS